MHPYHIKYPPEYWVCTTMRQRCTNPQAISYPHYGAKGITFSDAWNRFAQFYEDMGPRPGKGWTIERKNNDLGYSKENCVWATRKQQNWNRSCTRFIDFNGERMPIRAWAQKLGINERTLYARLSEYGWSVERAMTTGVQSCR